VEAGCRELSGDQEVENIAGEGEAEPKTVKRRAFQAGEGEVPLDYCLSETENSEYETYCPGKKATKWPKYHRREEPHAPNGPRGGRLDPSRHRKVQ
jgi:hypothetical protein